MHGQILQGLIMLSVVGLPTLTTCDSLSLLHQEIHGFVVWVAKQQSMYYMYNMYCVPIYKNIIIAVNTSYS